MSRHSRRTDRRERHRRAGQVPLDDEDVPTERGSTETALFAVRHREAPERLRGQIFTTGASLKLTGFAVGAAAAGPLATWSLPGALLTAAGIQLLAALSFSALSAMSTITDTVTVTE